MKKTLFFLMVLVSFFMTSHSIFAQDITITLYPGWTWISYPHAEEMDVVSALGDFVPAENDRIKSQYGSVIFSEGVWKGNLNQFSPGMGYMYYSDRDEVVTFVFAESIPPVVVTTVAPTDITEGSAICGGNVTSSDGDFVSVTNRGICWSTTPNPNFNDNYVEVGNGLGDFTVSLTGLHQGTTYYLRAFGVTAAGTYYGEEMNITTVGNSGGFDYIDLGLPSGTLWATCNVGATTPEEYGDYFAWGETQPKAEYEWSTYLYCHGTNTTLTKYCSNAIYGYNGFHDNLTVLQAEDDAATVNWGVDWRTPTSGEWQELYTHTTHVWTMQNGVYGRLFTASNGNSIFLPAAGAYYGGTLNNVSSGGAYWSSTLNTSNSRSAKNFYFNNSIYGLNSECNRRWGLSVRPVYSSRKN